ncbi:hypothetical protein ACSBR1_034585 [Camellia fascicularis]
MELKHSSHEHPLIFNTEHKSDGIDSFCYGCEQPVSGPSPSYSCSQCRFFLHKLCAEQPEQVVKHHLHPDHPLLFQHQPYRYKHTECSACRGTLQRFSYICPSPSCNFRLDAVCASMGYRIQQQVDDTRFHKHPLIPLHKPALFLCDACGKEHRDASFLCSTCGFWVSQQCASLPSIIPRSDRHRHPLTLIHSHPSRYTKFSTVCEICSDQVNISYWVYCCAKCKYYAHLYCALLQPELPRDGETEDEDEDLDPNPISLPMPDESVDMITEFMKEISLKGANKKAKQISHEKDREINHESHDHPLTFFDIQINDESSFGNKQKFVKNDTTKNDKICNGCVRPISASFYSCTACNFFLHVWCAKLPNTLDCACHPEHNLHRKFSQDTGQLVLCQGCKTDCNGFVFGCVDCSFFVDVKCASLPSAITHKAHTHTLMLRRTSGNDVQCTACNCTFSGLTFICDDCNFILDTRCALLPGTVRHRYDKHPFALTYSLSLIESMDEYYCEICEGEINLKLWFYHCGDCNQSLHTRCIHPIEKYLNIKFGTKLYLVDHFWHILTFVQHPEGNSPCNHCGELFHDRAAIECTEACNFRLHLECVHKKAKQTLGHPS